MAIKNDRLSSEEKTAEFELPDFPKKNQVVPPAPAIQNKVATLRTENLQLKQEIEEVKTESVRKVDEPTRVFNLRQAQMVQKLRELEAKKVATQKAIQKMLEEKNNTLHADLSKATATLVTESQRFAPLEKEFSEGMQKLSTLRAELQNVIEQSSSERKKNSQAIIDQGVEITNLQRLVQSCFDLMSKDYAHLSNSIRPLMDQKIELERELVELKTAHATFETEIKDQESRKFHLEIAISEAGRKIEAHKKVEEEKQEFLATLYERIEKAQTELESFKRKTFEIEEQKKHDFESYQLKLRELEEQKLSIENGIERLREEQALVEKNGETVKWSLASMTEQCELKKKTFEGLDKETIEVRKRIEDLRSEEASLHKSIANLSNTLHHLQGEVGGLEASRSAAYKLQEEAMSVLTERRQFYHQHVQDLEYAHKVKLAQLEKEYNDQKAEWDENFHHLEESQRASLEAKLEEQTVKYHSLLRDTQYALLSDMTKTVKRLFSKTAFESGQLRAEAAAEELEPMLKNYFNQTVNLHGKVWHNWRYWMYAMSGSGVVIAGLVAKIIWFK